MDKYNTEDSCPKCGSDNLEVFPDGTFRCGVCGFTNRRFMDMEQF